MQSKDSLVPRDSEGGVLYLGSVLGIECLIWGASFIEEGGCISWHAGVSIRASLLERVDCSTCSIQTHHMLCKNHERVVEPPLMYKEAN